MPYGRFKSLIVFIYLNILISPNCFAADECNFKGRVVSIEGRVEVRKPRTLNWHQVKFEEALCAGDMVRARVRSRASIRLANETMIRLDAKTAITFNDADENESSLIDFLQGKLHILTRTPMPFKIRTPFVNAGVEGTEFFIDVEENQTSITVFEGKISASNNHGNLILVDNEFGIFSNDQIPHKSNIVRKTDVVQWALHYPTIIDYKIDSSINDEFTLSIWSSALNAYRQGRLFDALTLLDRIEYLAATTQILTFKAGLLLSVGRVEDAKAVIDKALLLDERQSDAFALLSIIAIVQNDRDHALYLAKKAVNINKRSATAKLVLSYAQQAFFEIEESLISIEDAIKIDDKNSLAWARLAELQMSMGYLDRALTSAQRAVNLDPNLSKTKTVLGFSQLLQINIKAAQSSFMEAIKLDQSDAMPRLGLGLAFIREGKLEAGRVEIEIAASLDPLNSLVRSYLGKAYFEEKRYPLASTQFDLAKKYDPNDPTPWLYDGIMKQTQNQQNEALRDIEKSIRLNSNRAVYRSRLLLDQDQAVRGTSLSRIYDDFGFDQRALIQASRSLAYDPTSHSSHRFLSDAYTNIPHHEIARASELLQAQLLQPININPVQPRLGASDLNIISGGGPAAAFNEFTPLFERNRPQITTSGVIGNLGTLGNEIILSGIYSRASYSLGQFHYETNGFRPNANLINNNYDAFIQFAVSPKLNIQSEIRFRDTEHGHSVVSYFDKFSAPDRGKRHVNQKSFRLGASYSFSPTQKLITSGIYTLRQVNESFLNDINSNHNVNTDGYQFEAQYLFSHNKFNASAGGGIYNLDVENRIDLTDLYIKDFNLSNNKKINSYIYTNINLPRSINLVLGFSYDSYKDAFVKIDQPSPKLGFQWDITNNLRLRAAWFESIKSSLAAQQTLEPTQVAGFNQFFDDPSGTKSQRIGIALDSKVSSHFFAGIEASKRKLKLPLEQLQEELLYRAYLYWLPFKNWSFKSEFNFEKFKTLKDEFSFISSEDRKIQTLNIPVNVNYFHPSGFLFKFTGTFVSQLIKYPLNLGNQFSEILDNQYSKSDFYTFDTMVGYRFPNRRGMISVEGKNLFDQHFYYQNMNLNYPIDIGSNFGTLPRFVPDRTLFMRLTLNF